MYPLFAVNGCVMLIYRLRTKCNVSQLTVFHNVFLWVSVSLKVQGAIVFFAMVVQNNCTRNLFLIVSIFAIYSNY
jgi:hypothetical protein